MSQSKLPMRPFTRDEMMKRVAFYNELSSFTSGFSDAAVPNTLRRMSNVMGFKPPPNGQRSPVGSDASRSAAIDFAEGFNLAYVRCTPGNGPLMHNHDTSETFIPMTGRWRLSWNEDDTQYVDVGPWDVLSFPPGAARRFQNITEGEPDTEHVLMVIVSGNAPMAETTDNAKATIAHWEGVRDKEKASA